MKKAPKTVSSVRFTNGPEPGRSRNISTRCGPRFLSQTWDIDAHLLDRNARSLVRIETNDSDPHCVR